VKTSKKKISFFSTLNQYFPHIPYVAKKKHEKLGIKSILKYILLLKKRNGKKSETERNETIWLEKRNGTKQILNIKKRNETKRYG
jgi:hypothetical protein